MLTIVHFFRTLSKFNTLGAFEYYIRIPEVIKMSQPELKLSTTGV